MTYEGVVVGKNLKLSGGGLVFANEWQVGWFLGRVDPIGVGYIRFEVAGGHNSVRHGRGLVGAKNLKIEPSGLGFG